MYLSLNHYGPKPFCGLGGMFFKGKIRSVEEEKKSQIWKNTGTVQANDILGVFDHSRSKVCRSPVRKNQNFSMNQTCVVNPDSKKYQMLTPDSNDLCTYRSTL